MTTVGRLKDGEFMMTGEVNERMPVITNGLVAHYPLDGSTQRGDVPTDIRYIRDWANGSTATPNNHLTEIQVIDPSGANLASGKTITGSTAFDVSYPAANATDGNMNTYAQFTSVTVPQYFQLDLGAVYPVFQIKLWHFYNDVRTYHNTKVEVSVDGIKWYAIFDSVIEGEYVEIATGKILTLGSLGMTVKASDEVSLTFRDDGVSVDIPSINVTTDPLVAVAIPTSTVATTYGAWTFSSWSTDFQYSKVSAEYPGASAIRVTRLANTSGNGDFWNTGWRDNVAANTVHTISFYAKGQGNLLLTNQWAGGTLSVTLTPTLQRYYMVFTKGATATQYAFLKAGNFAVGDWAHIEQIQCENKGYCTSFVNGNRSTQSRLTIPINNVNLDTDPFSVIFKVRPSTNVSALVTASIQETGASATEYNHTGLMTFDTAAGGRFDMWLGRQSTNSTMALLSGLGVGGDWIYVGDAPALATDDIWVAVVCNGLTTTLYVVKNGKIFSGSRTRTGNVTQLRGIWLDGYAHGYLGSNLFSNFSVYNRVLTQTDVASISGTSMSLRQTGDTFTKQLEEKKDSLHDLPTYFHYDGQMNSNWTKYEQANCKVYVSQSVYAPETKYSFYIDRPPNITYNSADGTTSTMWGGVVVCPPPSLKKAGTYKLSFWYRGYTSGNSMEVYSAYSASYTSKGVGLHSPFGTTLSSFSTDVWKKFEYTYTVTDADINQTGTDAVVYDCMKEIKIGFGYQSTGAQGSRVFINKIEIAPVDNKEKSISKDKISFVEVKEKVGMNSLVVIAPANTQAAPRDYIPVQASSVQIQLNGNSVPGVISSRGLNLTIFDSNWTNIFSQAYDTYGLDQPRLDLAAKLSTITDTQFWVLGTVDASITNATLSSQMNSMGAKKFDSSMATALRNPYCCVGSGKQIIAEDGFPSTAVDLAKAVIQKTI